jgi:virulence factor
VGAAREAAAAQFDIPHTYAVVDELLDSEELDAVFVATPAHLNAASALPVIKRGIPTLMEKPPGLSVAETEGLRDAAVRSGAPVMVGWNRRFHPLIVQARTEVEARGPVTQLVGEFHKSMAGFERGGRFPEIVMDRMLLETPIHSIDIVRALAGAEVHEVHAVARRVCSRFRDVHAALVLFENGCVAQITANYTTDARLERYEIHGNGISACLEGVSRGTLFCDGGKRPLDAGHAGGGTREQARFFLDALRDRRPIGLPAANLDEAVKTMKLAEAILSSER